MIGDNHPPAVQPLTIGPKNAEALTGMSWRFVRDHAEELGVPLVQIGAKRVIPADEYVKALKRCAEGGADARAVEPEPTADDFAARHGKRRRRDASRG